MKILYLTKYTRMAGSSRMRSFQYFPFLEKAGCEITVKPFFDEAYLKDFYAGKKNISAVLKSYIRRFWVLFCAFKYDKIVVEKEIFPFLPAFAELLLNLFGRKYIVDYDDAIFHNYDKNSNPIIKKFLGNKIAKVMKYSSVVVAGNAYLAQYAKKSGAKKIEIIPTVIDLERYAANPLPLFRDGERSATEEKKTFIIGWIGTKTTFEKHLLPCKNWIKHLQIKHPEIHFHIIGITEDMDLGENVKYISWTEETEVSEILKMDVGIMPLQDSDWEKGKCAYKLIQYAACGIPGIASDVGMNREVCIDGKTGFIANNEEEWMEKLLFLKNNPKKRTEMGKNARALVEEKYCIQVTAGKWIKIIK